ncbi:hypothetical protein OOU_Y34scaffold00100g4 [Pyricularia oryzae Y34]|uniref:Rhodanese domain-containing protein n=1 Tax=Pyricularia oryzae (strain Y34) TaxID=1143189 RepID=A0AA97P908_PYRO3|nr:hypothetical protein OOU_Y34scaffold00100g4 [Pyricularia oryzae Y34]
MAKDFFLMAGVGRDQVLIAETMAFLFRYWGAICAGYVVAAGAFAGLDGIKHPFSIVVEAITVIELLWYVCWYLPYRHKLQRCTTEDGAMLQPPPLSREERSAFFCKCLSLVPDMETFVRKWVENAHLDDIRRDNVKDWLLWGLFDRQGPPGDDNEELEEYIRMAEEKLGWEIKKGRGEANAIRISYDEVLMHHRTLLYYLFVFFVDTLGALGMWALGYTFYRTKRSNFFRVFPFRISGLLAPKESAARDHMSYYVRPHKSTTKRPILFIHGIGMGVAQNLMYFNSIPKDVGVVVIELLPISARISPPLCTASQMAESVAAILDQQGFDDVVLVSQSYGTFLTTPLLLSPRVAPRISSCVLIDPVAFLLHLPDVAYNFTRRPPGRLEGAQHQMHMVARDPSISHTLHRRLSWREHILWRELLLSTAPSTAPAHVAQRRTTVILGGVDCITNPRAVASYIEFGRADCSQEEFDAFVASEKRWNGFKPLELIWLPGENHGAPLMKLSLVPLSAKVVDRYCRKDYDVGMGGALTKKATSGPSAHAAFNIHNKTLSRLAQLPRHRRDLPDRPSPTQRRRHPSAQEGDGNWNLSGFY